MQNSLENLLIFFFEKSKISELSGINILFCKNANKFLSVFKHKSKKLSFINFFISFEKKYNKQIIVINFSLQICSKYTNSIFSIIFIVLLIK